MQNSFPLSGPLSIGEMLDRAFRLYRTKLSLLLLTAAVVLIPFGIVSGLLTGNAMVGYFDILENMSSPQFDPSQSPNELFTTQLPQLFQFFGIIMGVSLIGVIFNAVATLALTRQEIGILNGEDITLGEGLRAGVNRLVAYIGMLLTQLAAYIGIGIGIALLFGCAIFAFTMIFAGSGFIPFEGGEPSPVLFSGFIIGIMCLYLVMILLFLLPLAYFTGRWAVAVPAFIEQNLGPIEALRYSWNMTKGHVRRSLIYVVLLFILSFILVSVPAIVISQVGALLMFSSDPALIQSLSTILTSLLGVFWIPLYTAAYVIFYYDLRVRNEGYDVSKRIEAFESDLDEKEFGEKKPSSI